MTEITRPILCENCGNHGVVTCENDTLPLSPVSVSPTFHLRVHKSRLGRLHVICEKCAAVVRI